jgi:hypothetical protein
LPEVSWRFALPAAEPELHPSSKRQLQDAEADRSKPPGCGFDYRNRGVKRVLADGRDTLQKDDTEPAGTLRQYGALIGIGVTGA